MNVATTYNNTMKLGNQGAQRFTMWLSIVSIMMTFGGFTSAFIVRKGAGGAWTAFTMPAIFNVSTLMILLSSATLIVAHISNKKGNKIMTAIGLLTTLILGILFCVFQVTGWTQLTNQGVYLAFNPNPAGPFFYVITAFHALHVIGGLLFMLIATIRSFLKLRQQTGNEIITELENSEKGKFTIRTDLLSMYWHFMGLLWLYLFIFLYLNFNH
ncbi:MAG: cytochrome c oxidase subunit 3 [Chitinophagales bacterium]